MERRLEEDKGGHILLAWSWILETLSDVKEVDTVLLKDIASRTPGIDNDLFRNARERISWRYLDELLHSSCSRSDCIQCKLPPLSSDGASTSRSCEGLLLLLSREASGDKRKLLKRLKRHHQFICHKGSCFSKPPLVMLKDAIVDEYHVSPPPNSEGTSPKENQHSVNNDTVPTNTDKHKTSKRSMNHLTSNDVPILNEIAAAQIAHMGDAIPSSEKHSGQQNLCNVHKETLLGGEEAHNKNDDAVLMPSEDTLPANALKPPTEEPLQGGGDIPRREGSNDRDTVVAETPTSSNEHSDKTARLSPHFHSKEGEVGGRGLPVSQGVDPVDTLCTEQGFCIKCNEVGNLLSCDGVGCPILVHESCLGSSFRFDDDDHFYCPYCSYKLAATAYRKAKEKLLLAQKALSSFMRTNENERQTQKRRLLKEERHPTQEKASHDIPSTKHRDPQCCVARNNFNSVQSSPCKGMEVSGHNQVASECQTGDAVVKLANHRDCLHYAEKMAMNHPENLTTDNTTLSNGVEMFSDSSEGPFPRRQKKVAWTEEEDKALKKAARIFPKEGRGIPWSKILAHGVGVFHESRAPVDLKDRWRKLQGKKFM